MKQANRTKSQFVWHDLVTFEVENAIRFYSDLLGWECKGYDMGGPDKYHMIHIGDKRIGGFMKPQKDNIPSHWIGYISINNLEVAASSITDLKGNILVEPTDIPDIGKFAIARDDYGAVFALFATNEDTPTENEPLGNLEFCWNEYLAEDLEKSKAFYGKIFGWNFSSMSKVPGMNYWLAKAGDREIAGITNLPKLQFSSNQWLIYIKITNIDDLTARVPNLGGRIIKEPFNITDHTKASIIEDSVGARIGLFEDSKD